MRYIIKILLVSFLALTYSSILLAQEPKSILTAPDEWRAELLAFPLSFAPSINFNGIEDIRFAKGWADSSSQEFWTYTFAWFIEDNFEISESSLAHVMEEYFDGLMGVVAKSGGDSSFSSKSMAIFIKSPKGYQGKIRAYDAFFSKKEMQLFVKVRKKACEKEKKMVVRFELSPRNFEDAVWEKFEEVSLKEICK